MKDLIFIAGAPGVGKSSVASELQKKFGSPCFEFGWIPEFRKRGEETIPYKEEEGIAFESLTFVVKNYVKHEFSNVIITDLEDARILELHKNFEDCKYILFTLTVGDDKLLKFRIQNEERSSKYRDWEAGLEINKKILARELLPNEIRIDTGGKPILDIVEEIYKYV
ncbi:MAG TPA: hypothetical protein ENI56_01525 [Candidatus Kaiserbacteria bacterium]|nr:hypothetical protein [Candidatus Kaiserbacteria bacterium]